MKFVTHPTDETLRDLYRSAQVTPFPAEEDFGIVAVESQACGTPVVELGKARSLDTVVDRVTGIHIAKQTTEELLAGMERVLDLPISAADCRANAERFSTANFQRDFADWVYTSAAKAGIDLKTSGEGDALA